MTRIEQDRLHSAVAARQTSDPRFVKEEVEVEVEAV